MDLEKVTAKIRPRQGWEAIDLGITLVQFHAKTLYRIWFTISLPIYIILMFALNASPEWIIVIFWWLKPILERPLLYFLSRELFGEGLNAKQCIKAFYSVAKIQWFASLTWRRFSFTRSFDLPLIQLEGLKGAERAKRLRTIHSANSGNAVWLTVIFSIVEMIIYLSILSLIYLLLPDVYLEDFNIWEWITADSESKIVTHSLNFILYLAISFIAPFFVACGFTLYLNQRTHLEAWDIELAFKRLASKLSEKSSNFNVRLASYIPIGLLLIVTNSFNPQQAIADEKNNTNGKIIAVSIETNKISSIQEAKYTPVDINNITHIEAKKIIEEIKKGNDFHQMKMEERHQYRDKLDVDQDDADSGFSSGWMIFAKLFAVLVEFALWIFVAVLILFLILKYKHLLVNSIPNKKIHKQRPKKLFGLDLNTESLPEKPWLAAKLLIEKQHYREALSLLYRASLIWYIDNSDASIKEGYTELECFEQISKHISNVSQQYLKILTLNWRSLAYAHQLPTENELIDLCDNWPKMFKNRLVSQTTNNVVGSTNQMEQKFDGNRVDPNNIGVRKVGDEK